MNCCADKRSRANHRSNPTIGETTDSTERFVVWNSAIRPLQDLVSVKLHLFVVETNNLIGRD